MSTPLSEGRSPERIRPASDAAGGERYDAKIKPGTAILGSVLGVLILAGLALFVLPEGSSVLKTAPLQVLLGTAIFLCLVALIVLVFARLGLYDRSAPLALPDGSVRALIALILLIIFIIFANVIFGQLLENTTSEPVAFSGLTQTQVDKLPGTLDAQRVAAGSTDATPLYDGIYRLSQPSKDATNLGQQIVTGLLTLVAAISAFYFGTGSVASAAKAIQPISRSGSQPRLAVLRPSQPLILSPLETGGYAKVKIELGGVELDESGVKGSIAANDPSGILVSQSAATYVYQPGKNAVHPVTLHFASSRDSSVGVDLVVTVPDPEEAGVADPAVPAQGRPGANDPEVPAQAREGADDVGQGI